MLENLNLETNFLHQGGNSSSNIFDNPSYINSDLKLPVTQPGGSSGQNLVFIDSALGQNSIFSSSFENAQVFWLAPNVDGVEQITQILTQYQNVASVHIVSHGSEGDVLLGNSHLNLANLSTYSSNLQSWREALTNDADVLFYGCNIGAGTQGWTFVQQLSQMTDADIAASNDLTGNADLGGDWELEVNTGTIESNSVLDTEAIAQYQSILPIYNGKNYILTSGAKTWEQAQAEAQSLGGNLVTINDATEQAWLRQTFGSSDQFWIGLTDRNVEGQFRWVNGETSTYTNWGPGQPDNWNNEDYVTMNWNDSGQWNDWNASFTTRGIIEITPSSTSTIALEQNTYSVNEAAGNVTIGVVRSGSTSGQSTVQYRLVNGTAVTGSDFTATSGTLTFAAGETRKTVAVPIINDTLTEANETFSLVIESPTGANLGTVTSGTVTILDDDTQTPKTYNGKNYILTSGAKTWAQAQAEAQSLGGNLVTINDASEQAWLRQTFGTTQRFWLGFSDRDVEGQFKWVNGEAVTYSNWAPSQPDNWAGNEDYAVMNWNNIGQWNDVSSTYVARGIIEVAPTPNSSIALEQNTYSVNEAAGNVTIGVVRSGNTSGQSTVQYRVVNGTSVAGSDFTATSGTLTFAVGETRKTVAVPIINDTLAEANENFSLVIESPTGANLGTVTSATVTILDDDTQTPKTYNGNNYILTSGAKTWEQAQAEAQSLGGNLVTINDASEQAWLRQTFGSSDEFWIGLTDRDVEGQFRWVSGETSTYTNWGPGQPDNWNNEDYVTMNWNDSGQWNDWNASFTTRGIIEITPSSTSAIALEQNTYSVNEAAGNVTIGVVRSGSTSGQATVQYRVDSGTAVAGSDFTATSGTLTFAAGETRKTFVVPIINDTLTEGNENFSLVVQSPTGASLGTIRTATVTVIDDDSTVLTISQPQVNENAGNAVITLTRGNGNGSASVNFTTVNGTAFAGSDYQTTSGQVTFAAGQTSRTISIPLINDSTGESDETFRVQFSNPVGVTLGSVTSATVNILDDDAGNFIRETFISGLTEPTAFVRTPDNSLMFILEKRGIVKVAQGNTVLATNFIDLTRDVNNVRDRGALGLAIHPQFFNGSPYIYVSYTYDPPEAYLNTNPNTNLDDPDQFGNRPARIVRITADAANGYRTAVPNSQVVILGKNSNWANTSRPDGNSTTDFTISESGRTANGGYVQDYIKTDSESHTIGHLAFGSDGALYVSVGDGTSYNAVDTRAVSVLNPDSLSGKILRVDPLTGQGLADNPFFNGDPNSNRSKVWNLGLRNPFRFTIKPGTSTPFIGDVGWYIWEEVNVGTRGANFGWPAYEGGLDANGNPTNLRQVGYDATIPAIAELYNSPQTVTAPIYARSHVDGARAIIMGDFYDGNTFPSEYNNALFIADANEGTVDALTLDSQNRVTAVRRFASGVPGIVYMETGPDGNLYYVNLVTNAIERWRFA